MGDLAVMPGLVDAHARLPDGTNESHGPLLLAAGVTTVVAAHEEALAERFLDFCNARPEVRVIGRTGADIGGRTFFIRSHPLRHAAEGGWSEIVMHEVIHYISAHQAPEQK